MSAVSTVPVACGGCGWIAVGAGQSASHTPTFCPPFDRGLPRHQTFQILCLSFPRRGTQSPPVFFRKASLRLVFTDYFAIFPVFHPPLETVYFMALGLTSFPHARGHRPSARSSASFPAPLLFTSRCSLGLTPKLTLTPRLTTD